MKRTAISTWEGSIKEGKGTTSTESKILDKTPFSFGSRFTHDGDKATNPEELIAAAHASCFSMMLSNLLGQANLTAKHIETKAEVTLDTNTGTVTSSHLFLKANVPHATKEQFAEIAKNAETNCPISKLFKAEIKLEYELTN